MSEITDSFDGTLASAPETDQAEETLQPLRQPEGRVAEPMAPEYDRRGVQLPARSRVGGIITPQ